MQTGTVKSYNPHKGILVVRWGFVECNGQDSFLYKKELKGQCPSAIGMQLAFYFGEIKRFNPVKGYGFISCEAFEQDVFVLKSELPQGAARNHNGTVSSQEEKGPAAKQIQLLGAAGNQAQQMKAWMWPTKGWGKGWAMPFPFMGMKGFDKGWGKGGGYGKGGKS
eukprot:Skav228341  [mRNA]  locus=scaffold1898:136267:139808:- [translate_table: standard]